MRQHPISPVTEPLQYRAIGVVRGQYVPSDSEQLTRGLIRTDDGSEIDAVVLGRVLSLVRRHLDLERSHLWVVYPRCREPGALHLQMVGVWEPSTLSEAEPETDAETDADAEAVPDGEAEALATAEAEPSRDALPEGDDYFSVRGELIYTRPDARELVVKVRQQPRPDGSRPQPFKLPLRGEVPLAHLRHFVSLDLRRLGHHLELEHFEVIGPVAQRGNRGGKGRPQRPGSGGPSGPKAGHRSAVSRPGG